jgi:hypothetical protein
MRMPFFRLPQAPLRRVPPPPRFGSPSRQAPHPLLTSAPAVAFLQVYRMQDAARNDRTMLIQPIESTASAIDGAP